MYFKIKYSNSNKFADQSYNRLKLENDKLINANSEIRKNLNEKQLEYDIIIQNLKNQHEAEIKKLNQAKDSILKEK